MKDLLNKGFQPVTETEMVMVEGGERSLNKKLGLEGFKFEEKDGFSFSASGASADINYKTGNTTLSSGIIFSSGKGNGWDLEFGNGSFVKVSGGGASFSVHSIRFSVGFSY